MKCDYLNSESVCIDPENLMSFAVPLIAARKTDRPTQLIATKGSFVIEMVFFTLTAFASIKFTAFSVSAAILESFDMHNALTISEHLMNELHAPVSGLIIITLFPHETASLVESGENAAQEKLSPMLIGIVLSIDVRFV